MGLALLPGRREGCTRGEGVLPEISQQGAHLAPSPFGIECCWDMDSGRAQYPFFAEALGTWPGPFCHWLGLGLQGGQEGASAASLLCAQPWN